MPQEAQAPLVAVTLTCNKCKQRFRLTRMEPATQIIAPQYCPLCGHNSVGITQDSEQDFWEAMARHYNMRIKLLRLLYDMWVQETPTRFYRFGDFIDDALSKSAAT